MKLIKRINPYSKPFPCGYCEAWTALEPISGPHWPVSAQFPVEQFIDKLPATLFILEQNLANIILGDPI